MVVIHHTASDVTMEKEIISTKRHRGKVPYHYLIWKNGEIVQTRSLKDSPGATLNWEANKYWIQIALIGNFNNTEPTQTQKESLQKLIRKFNLPIKLHRDVWQTACPWKYFSF